MQVDFIDDVLQRDLLEIAATGILKTGETALKELIRRKLISPKYFSNAAVKSDN